MTDSSKFTSRLRGQKVLIFGGSSGIGYSAAEACVENGMVVVIASSSESRVNDAVKRILKEYPSASNRISGQTCDLANQATVEDSIVKLFEKVGKLDHIIYSAGDSLAGVTVPLDKIDVDQAVKSHMVRYFAPMMVGKHAKKYLSPGPASSITFTSGAIVMRPTPDWVLAKGSLHAVEGLSQALALELAPVRVNVVQPGAIETELWTDKEVLAGLKSHIEATVPTQRLAQPEDIAEAYLYTMKDINVTGAIIQSNSGALLK